MKKRVARKILLKCPRCGRSQSVLQAETRFMVICPRCGAGMREAQVRSRLRA